MGRENNIIQLFMNSVEIMKELENKPKDFGTGELLHSSLTHTLVIIGNNPGINLTELSIKLEVSKSAVSKVIKKLLEKSLINKSKDIHNQKEVIFHLTKKGIIVYRGHEDFKKKLFGNIVDIINEMDEKQQQDMELFLKNIISEFREARKNI